MSEKISIKATVRTRPHSSLSQGMLKKRTRWGCVYLPTVWIGKKVIVLDIVEVKKMLKGVKR
jgi:hypothetical protein